MFDDFDDEENERFVSKTQSKGHDFSTITKDRDGLSRALKILQEHVHEEILERTQYNKHHNNRKAAVAFANFVEQKIESGKLPLQYGTPGRDMYDMMINPSEDGSSHKQRYHSQYREDVIDQFLEDKEQYISAMGEYEKLQNMQLNNLEEFQDRLTIIGEKLKHANKETMAQELQENLISTHRLYWNKATMIDEGMKSISKYVFSRPDFVPQLGAKVKNYFDEDVYAQCEQDDKHWDEVASRVGLRYMREYTSRARLEPWRENSYTNDREPYVDGDEFRWYSYSTFNSDPAYKCIMDRTKEMIDTAEDKRQNEELENYIKNPQKPAAGWRKFLSPYVPEVASTYIKEARER